MGVSLGALVAATWAASHAERVVRLVLYGGWARGRELADDAVREDVVRLVRSHWGLGSDLLTDIFAPDATASTRAAFARYQRGSSSPEQAAAMLALAYDCDITGVLHDIAAPTLVLHREHDRAAPLAQGRELATRIPGARLEILTGRSHLPHIGDADSVTNSVRRFLGLPARRTAEGSPLTRRQQEVAALVAEGCTNREIASRLGINERSAEGHVERIRLRLGLRSRAQVAAWFVGRTARE